MFLHGNLDMLEAIEEVEKEYFNVECIDDFTVQYLQIAEKNLQISQLLELTR